MAINLGNLTNNNNNNNDNEYKNVDGIKLRKQVQIAPTVSSKQTKSTKSKSSHYDLLDDGYQFGDFTRMFLGEAKQGANNLKNTVINAPKNIVNTGKNIINESEAMKDGYQFGDISKTIGSTVLSTAQNFGEGVIRGAEGMIDFGADLTGGASDWINTKLEKAVGLHKGKTELEVNKEKAQARKEMIATNYTDKLMESVGKDDFYKDLVESNSLVKTDNMGGAVAQELGRQSLNLLATNKIGATNKFTQSIPMLAGSYGSGIEEAYQNGATTSEARRYGIMNAATETVTEWITGGIPGLKGTAGAGLDGIASKLIGEGIEESSKKLSKAILKSGYKLIGEGTEEALSEFINPYLKQFTYNYNSDKSVLGNLGEATKNVSLQDMMTSFIMGAITAGIIDAPNNISDIRGTFKNNTSINDNTSTNLSKINQSNINNPETQNSSQNGLNQLNNSIQNNSNNSYQYEQSNNQKINILKESASKYFDNSETTKNLLDTYSKIIQDKNYNVIFDDTITNNNNQYVNAQIKTLPNGETEIRINPNSDRAGEFLIMHEVTHAIETNSMKELVLDYASKNPEFNQALESLKQTYGTDDVSSEVLADISGQLFGNQEFINNLSMEKPNIFKRIYNSIISLANKIRGNSKESLFIKDLKNKWESAYRNTSTNQAISNLNNKTKYSTIGLRGAKSLENNSTDRYYKNLYKGQKNAELIHNSSDKDLETTNIKTKKETGWFKTKYNDWGTLISDKNSKIIKKLEANKSYKLGEILEHDLLYAAYPELRKLKVITTDIKPTANIAKYKNLPANEYTTEIYLKNDDLNKKDFRNSLLHEINHYIEMREHYDKNSIGSNTNIDSKEDYKNNLGEIISNETKIYSDFTQQELDDIILPEQAKNNPKYENIKEKLKEVNKKDHYVEGENKNVTKTNKNLSQNKFKDNSLVNNESSNNSRIKDYYSDEELDNSSFSLLKNSDGKQIDISNLKENQTMERFHYNRKYDKNNIVAYRGESENTGNNPAFYGLGLYTTLDSKYAKQYGNVSIIDSDLLPDNPLKFKTQNDFGIWEQELARKLGIRKRELYSNDYGVEQYIKKLGYDGLMIGTGKDTDLISFKDSAIKYSKENPAWQEHLEKNYKSTGTRTEMNKIKKGSIAPKITSQETRKLATEIKKETPIKEVNQKKFENNENAIKRLEQEKDALTKRIEDKIKQKQQLLNSKQNKDTKLSTQLNIQISNLNNQLQNRKLDYDRRIEYYKNKNEKMNSNEFKIQEQRITKKQEYIDQAYELTENMVDWKDKSAGIKYQINTMKRNMYDIMSKTDADKIYSTYFQPISENNAKSENFINYYNERIKKFNLSNKESVAVQMLGEYKYNKETLLTGPQVDQYISDNKLDYDKLSNAVEEFRTIYDELIVETNKILKEQGYKEIEYRKGYFPHFQEEKPQSKFAKLAEKMGFKIDKNQLPTDIAGMTEIFKPGRTYFKNAQQRLGKTTDYNALKGFDNYIRGAADLIFHTEDIQKLRALETVIRTQYTDDAIRQKIESISNNRDYDQEQKQALIDLEFAKINNPLPNLVTEIRNYTDSLANKKDIGDRGMEHMLGRETYTIMKNVQSRVSANMVGFNISSALTNFIPITQAWSQVSTKNMAKAIKQSIANQFRNDGFADASTYLINRTQQADRLYKTGLDKINSKAGAIFEAVDEITSNIIVRGKYLDNIDKGMTEFNAMKNANEFAKDIMAGRDKGSMPTIFNRKSPLVKLVTAFQLEVNNQYGYMLKDLPRDLGDEAKKKLVGAFVKMFLGAWLYNQFSEAITGRKSAFSPIDIVGDSVKTVMNDNLSSYDKISNITTDMVGELPFIGGILGGGRLPIQSAIPDIGITTESITQLSKDDTRNKAIKNLTKELSKPLFYVVMPFGGGQLKKTIEGASMYTHDVAGSYTSSGKLRFEAPKNPIGVTKSLIFGQYSSKNAKEYFDKGYAPLTEKQIKEWKSLDISLSEYRKYRTDFTDLSSIKSDKDSNNKTIKGSASGKKAYSIMNNDALSKKEKNYLLSALSSSDDDNITVDKLNKIANDQEIYKFFYSLNTDNRKKFINDIENNGFDSYQLYEYYQTKNQYEKSYTNLKTKELIIDYLVTSNLNDSQKYYLYSKDYASNDTINLLNSFNVKVDNYLNTMKYVNDVKNSYIGNSYKNYRRNEIYKYINGLNASILEKVILYKQAGYSISNYKSSLYDYIEKMPLTAIEKKKIWNQLF